MDEAPELARLCQESPPSVPSCSCAAKRGFMRVFRAAGSEVKRLLGFGNPTTMPSDEDIVPLETPAGYAPLDIASIPAFLSRQPGIAARLGGQPVDWQVSEVGDGNLNLVFLVKGPAGGVCVKQALPYVRLVGEAWPMPLQRTFFEHECLKEHGRHVGRLLPAVYHYEPALYAIVSEQLETHVVTRRGMIRGTVYPWFAEDISRYLARSLFFTSDLALPAGDKKHRMAVFSGNTSLCKITDDLVFTDPYL